MKKSIFFFLFISMFLNGQAQHIYREEFSDCKTDWIGLESDTIVAKIDMKHLVKTLISGLDEKTKEYLSGVLYLQIIVDTEGNSCLVSIANDTPFQTSQLNLKQSINNRLIWQKPSKKISPLIMLRFLSNSVQYKRIGFNGNKGKHIIEEGEILIE